MNDPWFSLERSTQAEVLDVAADRSKHQAHLLEKDIWVVWVLDTIYTSTLASKVTFKGGTSLSKAYKLIDRFSEDIDLTYDIRELVGDKLADGNPIPATSSQEKKISSAVRARLPDWIAGTVRPILETALSNAGMDATVTQAGKQLDQLILTYPAVSSGSGYSSPQVLLEFGARATGEPNEIRPIDCDIAPLVAGFEFPTAKPLVMAAERTFWEKATAAHVYCLQHRIRGERYSRHWYDLAAMAGTDCFRRALTDLPVAESVAAHKSMYFAEKNADGQWIDYVDAIRGNLQLIPDGEALAALAHDYAAMTNDGLLLASQPSFDAIMETCRSVERSLNERMRPKDTASI